MRLLEILEEVIKTADLREIDSITKAINGPLWLKSESGQRLIDYLNQDVKYEKFNNHLQYLGNNGWNVTLDKLADWLVERAKEVGGSKAIEELEQYLSSKEVVVYGIVLLSSVYIEEEYIFCNDVKIVNGRGIPNKKLTYTILNNLLNPSLPLPAVDSVFIVPFKYEIKHLSQEENHLNNSTFSNVSTIPIEKIEDAKDCLILTRCLYGIHTIAEGVIAPDCLPFISSTSGWSLHSLTLPNLAPSIIEIELEKANELLKTYKELTPELKQKLKVSITYFNNFCSSSSIVDRAISLRTCLESIFLNDDNKEQLRYRLGLRGALFLGKDTSDKKRILKTLKDTYDITSTAVHQGIIKEKQMKRINILDESALLAREAIIKIIEHGLADWEDLELR